MIMLGSLQQSSAKSYLARTKHAEQNTRQQIHQMHLLLNGARDQDPPDIASMGGSLTERTTHEGDSID